MGSIIGLAGGRSVCAYTGGNPTNYVDPDGQHPVLFAFGIAMAGLELYDLAMGAKDVYDAANDSCSTSGDVASAIGWMAIGMVDPTPGNFGKKIAKSKSLGANPFEGKTPPQIDKMLRERGFRAEGRDPLNGKGSYVNSKTGRGYHIDGSHPLPKGPHVGVHRPRGPHRDTMKPRDYMLGVK